LNQEPYRTVSLKTSEDFGRLIRTRRRSLGLSQLDLALTINAGERFIVDLEKGKPSCQLGKALQAAAALGIRLGDVAGAEWNDDHGGGYEGLFDDP
jgi:y4mF family transcriptional regulator